MLDLVGKKFGRLTVVSKGIDVSKYGRSYWNCVCNCGKKLGVRTSDLRTSNTKSCGCLQKERASESNIIDLKGKRFGRLVAIEKVGVSNSRFVKWRCLCDCNTVIITDSVNLTGGDTTSCGCYQREITGKKNTKNLEGKRFGKLEVIGKQSRYFKTGQVIWKCKCDCGRYSFPLGYNLTSGRSTTCGVCNGPVSKSGNYFLDCVENMFGIKLEREYLLGRYRFDGRCGKILIEVDGSYWHRSLKTRKRDAKKEKLAIKNGFIVVRCKVDSVDEVPERLSFYKKQIGKVFR